MQVTDRRPAEATDVALLGRIVAGDEDALAALYDRHGRLMFGLILRVLHDKSEAEEVLQEVFLSVWSKAGAFDAAIGPPVAWLVRLARNRSIDRLRANTVRARTLEAVDDPPTGDNPESNAVRSEQQEGIRRALASLPADQRALIEHAYYLGFTQSELAARFDLPLGTVKTRVRSGMMALREQLTPHE